MTSFRDIKEPPKFTLTKLDAARRQLKTAVKLWFMEDDPVSIHSLAYASHEIIHKLYKKRGLKDLMYDSSVVKEEYRSEFAHSLKGDANFIKHSNRSDESESIEFKPLANDLFILMSLIGLERMGENLGDEESAFMFWMYLHNPHWWDGDQVSGNRIPIEIRSQLVAIGKELGRGQFFKAYLEIKRNAAPDGKID